eukprot:8815517-Pyramimonas_sp.AAC.1
MKAAYIADSPSGMWPDIAVGDVESAYPNACDLLNAGPLMIGAAMESVTQLRDLIGIGRWVQRAGCKILPPYRRPAAKAFE